MNYLGKDANLRFMCTTKFYRINMANLHKVEKAKAFLMSLLKKKKKAKLNFQNKMKT